MEYDEILEDPTKVGMPTFEEFKRNREKYMGRDDDILASADAGSTILKNATRRHIYEIEGYRCESLEEVERVANAQGIPIKDLDYRPELIQAGAGKFDTIVKFVSKHTRQKRDEWK